MSNLKSSDILIWVAVRSLLRRAAELASRLETDGLDRFLKAARAELEVLRPGGPFSELWVNAISALDGPDQYGLQRVRLHPTEIDT